MAYKLKYIPNDDTQNYSVDYNWWLKLLETQLDESTNQISQLETQSCSVKEKKNDNIKLWGLVL